MDWNNDGKKDLIIGESYNSGTVRIYLNSGTDAAPVFSGYSYLQVGGSNFRVSNQAMPFVVDWNNDGKKDVLCGEINGRIYYLRNTGTDASPVFAASTFIQNSGANLDAGSRSAPVVCDWDGDGKKDLLVGRDGGQIRFYRNTGTDASPGFSGYANVQAEGQTIDVGSYARPTVYDWNQDGILDLLVGNDQGSVTYFSALDPTSPLIRVLSAIALDAGGDNDCRLDPNETAQIWVTVQNQSAAASNVMGRLVSSSPTVQVTSDTAEFGDLGGGAFGRCSGQPFGVAADAGAAENGVYFFELQTWYDGAHATDRVDLVVGQYEYNGSDAYAWVNTSGGTVLPLTWWNDRVNLPLSFDFPYYDATYNQVRVYALGYIAVGTTPAADYLATRLPDPAEPNSIIAPLWFRNILHPATNTCAVRYVQGGTAPNRYCAIEWYRVPSYFYVGSEATFQAVLHEDGTIKFQYGYMSSEFGYGARSSVGIESRGGLSGLQHSYYLSDSCGNGRCVTFSLTGGSPDSDGDGMPDEAEQFFFGGTGMGRDGDEDHDGMGNYAELHSGTDPGNPNSILKISDLAVGTGGVVLTWPNIPGIKYTLQSCSNPVPVSWQDIQTNIDTGCWTTQVNRAKQEFFRVAVP